MIQFECISCFKKYNKFNKSAAISTNFIFSFHHPYILIPPPCSFHHHVLIQFAQFTSKCFLNYPSQFICIYLQIIIIVVPSPSIIGLLPCWLNIWIFKNIKQQNCYTLESNELKNIIFHIKRSNTNLANRIQILPPISFAKIKFSRQKFLPNKISSFFLKKIFLSTSNRRT